MYTKMYDYFDVSLRAAAAANSRTNSLPPTTKFAATGVAIRLLAGLSTLSSVWLTPLPPRVFCRQRRANPTP